MHDRSPRREGSSAARTRSGLGALPLFAVVLLTGFAAFGAGAAPKTQLLSVDAAGTGSGDRQSINPALNANGRIVAFQSEASNLVAGDTNKEYDVFVRDVRKRTTLVSVNGSGNDRSEDASVSADGRLVAFSSRATDLVTATVTGNRDVYVRDLRRGTTTLASMNAAGTAGADAGSYIPSISSNGRFLTFTSEGSGSGLDLVSPPVQGGGHVFVRDLKKQRNTLVSFNFAGTGGADNWSECSAISGDGRFVAFTSPATDLVAGHSGTEEDVFVRDVR